MDQREALEVLQLPALREVTNALLKMSREGAWGHVTVRFQGGEIRQVDTLTTTRCGEIEQERSDRAA